MDEISRLRSDLIHQNSARNDMGMLIEGKTIYFTSKMNLSNLNIMLNTQKIFIDLYKRDLDRLSTEIEAVPDAFLWQVQPGIINSCGVLTQHLIGNLRHFIGAGLGDTGYERNREREFTNTELSKDVLIGQITELKKEISTVLNSLSEEEFQAQYAKPFPFEATVTEALMHLYGHLNYHLGQINYLRRMIEEKG